MTCQNCARPSNSGIDNTSTADANSEMSVEAAGNVSGGSNITASISESVDRSSNENALTHSDQTVDVGIMEDHKTLSPLS